MENYEKKYKEALSWAHSAIKAGADGMLKEDLERIFPELHEAEDERIRKEIISYIKSSGAVTNPNWIAWLEKQAEQKPAWSEEDEKMLESAIWHVSYSASNGKSTDYQCQVTDWLKSIKPIHWKPSEQNIKDLEWCADLVKDKMGVGFHRLQVFIDELKSL